LSFNEQSMTVCYYNREEIRKELSDYYFLDENIPSKTFEV